MSQYRDDRAAASLRIEALEASVAERDAELARQGVALAERDEEILRLQRELDRAGGAARVRRGPPAAAQASRLAGVASTLMILAAGASMTSMRPPAATRPGPPIVVPRIAAPIHADPLVGSTVDWTTQVPDPLAPKTRAPAAEAAGAGQQARTLDFKVWDTATETSTEDQVRRQLEAKVERRQATTDDLRMLKAICSHQQDRACRDRAQALLAGAKR